MMMMLFMISLYSCLVNSSDCSAFIVVFEAANCCSFHIKFKFRQTEDKSVLISIIFFVRFNCR